jgi:hypothetical protein
VFSDDMPKYQFTSCCFAIANYFTLIAICVFAKQYSDDMAATTSSSDENANVGKTLNLF